MHRNIDYRAIQGRRHDYETLAKHIPCSHVRIRPRPALTPAHRAICPSHTSVLPHPAMDASVQVAAVLATVALACALYRLLTRPSLADVPGPEATSFWLGMCVLSAAVIVPRPTALAC